MSDTKRESGFRSWVILGAIAFTIIVITGSLIYLSQPEKYPLPSGWETIRPPYAILALAEQSDVIWAGGADGVFAIDRYTGKLISSVSAKLLKIKYVRDLCIDWQGALWIAHETGLTRVDNDQQRTFTIDDGLPQGYCAAVIEDLEGNIWVGTETGIAKFDGRAWHNLTAESGFGKIPVTIIFEDSDGVIWFGSDSVNSNGLMSYDGKKWSSFPNTEGLVVHNTVTDILEDKDGNLWVASGLGNTGGATCIKESGVTVLTMEDGLRGGRVRSLFQDSLGRLWFASEFQGSVIFNGNDRYIVTPEQGLAGWEVMEMIEDSSGVLWLATENGITRITSVNSVPAR